MKRVLSLALVMVMVFTLLPASAFAATVVDSGTCGDNLTWTFDSAGTLTISGTGDMDDYSSWGGSQPWGPYVYSAIKAVIIGNDVTSIGDYAFYGCYSLKMVEIGESVKSIGDGAVESCDRDSYLTFLGDEPTEVGEDVFPRYDAGIHIYVPENNDTWTNSSFYNDDTQTWRGNPVTFCNHDYDKEVTPATCLNGGYTTHYCTKCGAGYKNDYTDPSGHHFAGGSCTRCGMPENAIASGTCGKRLMWYLDENQVLTISGTGEMNDCQGDQPWQEYRESIETVDIKPGVESIGYYAFFECSKLSNVVLPESLVSIDNNAFRGCSSLASITIPDSVTKIGDCAFDSCSMLKDITLPAGLTCLEEAVLYCCTSLESVTIPENVTCIESEAFFGCTALKNVAIPDSVTEICSAACHQCSALECVTIPAGVTRIEGYAFNSCSKLTSAVFEGNAPAEFGGAVFDNCSADFTIYAPENNGTWTKPNVYDADKHTWNGYPIEFAQTCNHNYSHETVAPTCTDEGYTVYTCSKCGSSYTDNRVSALGHSYGEWEETKAPSCTEKGAEKRSCIRCGAEDTRKTAVLGHSYGEWKEAKAPTCTEKGAEKRCCIRCDVFETRETAVLGHSYVDGICTRCGCEEIVGSGTCGDNLTWVLDGKGALTISGTGAMSDYDSWKTAPWIEFESRINKVIFNDGITRIGDRAFIGCTSLVSVNIPDSVKDIGYCAFYGCGNLTSVVIPDSVTSIEAGTFKHCSNLKSVSIGRGVKSIGSEVFSNCVNLTEVYYNAKDAEDLEYKSDAFYYAGESGDELSVIIGDDVEIVPGYLFEGGRIKSLYIGKNVKSISGTAFSGCYNVSELYYNAKSISDSNENSSVFSTLAIRSEKLNVVFGDSVERIPSYMFNRCSHLTSITITDSVTSIGENAFSDNSLITSVTIPSSISYIGSNAFSKCENLSKVYYNATVMDDSSEWSNIFSSSGYKGDGIEVEFGDAVEIIPECLFENCAGLKNISIGKNVKSIGKHAFCNCDGLTSIIIPESVTHIGANAFSNCGILSEIFFNATSMDDLTGANIFEDSGTECNGINVEFGDAVEKIPAWLFGRCRVLKSAKIGNSVTSIGDYAFYNCSSLTRVTIGEGATSIGEYAFSGCSSLTRVSIPDSVTSIGDSAFSGCSSLTSVTIPDSVTSIGSGTFSGCSSIKSVTIPDSVTSVGDFAFNGCNSLESVTIPDSVTSIGGSAFSGCSSLTSVTIPDSVTSIEPYAFAYCNRLEKVYYNTSSTSGYTSISEIFDRSGTNDNGISIVFGHNVKSVSEYHINYSAGLVSMTIRDGVTCIWDYEYQYCDYLTSVTIPNSVTLIDEGAFCLCKNLKSVTIGSGVKHILGGAFYGCTNLSDVYYAGSETEWNNINIGNYSNELRRANIHYNSTGPDDINTAIQQVSYLSGYDKKANQIFFNDCELAYSITDTTDMSSIASLEDMVGKYVLIEADDENIFEVTSIKPVESGIGTVNSTKSEFKDGVPYLTSITIDGMTYAVSSTIMETYDFDGAKVLFHVSDGKVAGVEILQHCGGRLEKLDRAGNTVTIGGRQYKTNYLTDWSWAEGGDSLKGSRVGYYFNDYFLFGVEDEFDSKTLLWFNNASRSYRVGEKIIMAIYEDGMDFEYGEKCCSISVDDDSVIKFCGYYSYPEIAEFRSVDPGNPFRVISEDLKCCSFAVFDAKSPGNSNVIVTNNETGEIINVSFAVGEDIYKTFRFDNIQSYPYILKAFGQTTVIDYYNAHINGMWVADMKSEKVKGGYNLTMKVYNEAYIPGVVEAYNKAGEIVDADVIKKFEGTGTGIVKTFQDAYYLFEDFAKGDLVTFRNSTCAKESNIEVFVPDGGFIRITNDCAISPCCFVVNLTDYVFSVNNLIGDVKSLANLPAEQIDIVTKEVLLKYICNQANLKLVESFQKKIAENMGEASFGILLSNFMGEAGQVARDLFDEINLDMDEICKTAISTGTGFAESVFKRVSGAPGIALSAIFAWQSANNLLVQTKHWAETWNSGNFYAALSPLSDTESNRQTSADGITVETNNVASDTTVLQTYKVLRGDALYISESSGEVLNDYTMYNIALMDKGKEVQPNGFVTVYIPLPEGYKDITVIREKDNGAWELIDFTVDNGVITFEVNHFCNFAICNNASSTYSKVSVLPTCTDKGYTIYTIDNANSYKSDFVMPLGHDYVDGACTRCGEKDPNYKPPVQENPFTDVSADSVYYDAILWAYYHTPNQITSGYTATEFCPQNPCTRAQVVTFLWRAAGCPEPTGDVSIFKDADDIASPFLKAVAWAVEKGITTGFNDGTFRPNDSVTRAQFVTFLYRFEGKPATSGSIDIFPDAAEIAGPYQQAVAWAVEKGITSGYYDGTFRPDDVCTRWAVVLFMYRDMT